MPAKKQKETEEIKSLRTFGYTLKNGMAGKVDAVNEQDAYDKIRKVASQFSLHGQKVWIDFFEVKE